jgi:hypothetical protein
MSTGRATGRATTAPNHPGNGAHGAHGITARGALRGAPGRTTAVPSGRSAPHVVGRSPRTQKASNHD